jgi:hypothetical protein
MGVELQWVVGKKGERIAHGCKKRLVEVYGRGTRGEANLETHEAGPFFMLAIAFETGLSLGGKENLFRL